MYPKNMMKNKAVTELYNFLKEQNYGEEFSWETLKEKSRIENLNQEDLYNILYKVNKMLMTYDMRYLETIHEFGKRIAKPNEHSNISRNRIKRAVKQYRKAGQIIASTNESMLTKEEIEVIRGDANKWRTLEMFTNELIKNKKITDENKDKKSIEVMADLVKTLIKK